MATELCVGTMVEHPKFGKGVVGKVNLTTVDVYFEMGGKYEFSKSFGEFEILNQPETKEDSTEGFSLKEIEQVIAYVLDKYEALPAKVYLGKKWTGGSMILKPGDDSLKEKEIPIEAFFHKIVMLRDRLRVLEQNINSHKVLTDEEKVHLQQYITRIYGSLTTFNLLFEDREDYFVGASSNK
jgi:hypothetical protein